MRRWAALAFTGLLAAAASPGCSDRPATTLVVALSSEAAVPDEVDALSLEVKRGDRVTFAQRYVVNKTTHEVDLPGTLTLEPLEDEPLSSLIRITVRAEQHQEQVSLRSATMVFVEEKQKIVRLVIRYSCLDFPKACGEGQTCLGGRCGSDAIDTSKLPDFTGGTVFPTASAGGCFDASDAQCGASLTEVDSASFAADECQLDLSASPGFDAARLNVFAFWRDRIDQGHAVVLDRDPDDLPAGQPGEGWGLVPGTTGTIRLAGGLCDLVKSGSLLRVAYNFACATKTLELPICQLDPGAATTLADSACVTCTYFNPADACLPSTYEPGDASAALFEAARACPFDGHYDTTAECQSTQSCFFDRLAPFLGCEGSGCDAYKGAAAWSACIGQLAPVAERCAAVCGSENVNLCYAAAGGP